MSVCYPIPIPIRIQRCYTSALTSIPSYQHHHNYNNNINSKSFPSSTFSINTVKTLLQVQQSWNFVEERRRRNREMGSLPQQNQRKPRFLCLHGFRTSAKIMKTQIGKWPESVLEKMDLVFVDAPFPCQGKSEVEGIFDPPYYEWFQSNKEWTEHTNFEECLTCIEDYMLKLGPFDGLIGFSQGSILSAALPGLQKKGLALTKVPKIKCLIIIGGAMFRNPSIVENAYASKNNFPTLHFLGETDFLKPHGIKLLETFVDPVVIHHPKGHTVPRLDEKGVEVMNNFLDNIQESLRSDDELPTGEEETEEAMV